MDRRTAIIGAGSEVVAATAFAKNGASSRAGTEQAKTYNDAVKQVWRDLGPAGGVREIVRAGSLAANCHNTTPRPHGHCGSRPEN